MKDNRFEWFENAGLGLFIHWGLYSIPAKGEWLMNRERIPVDEYDQYAEQFCPPADFSPGNWVKLAVRMGAKYAVLTTRHHDGFALWDSRNNPFNSVKTAARRDFVREFVDACRKHDIRVGLYYSIMSWQYGEKITSRDFDQQVWDRQVADTHAQLEELMTGYGKIDLLWYDGCCAPGADDMLAMDKMWHTKALNAMVRRHQPDILINDRSCQPEDFSTPEQCLTPPPAGRHWESCITMNHSWGYTATDNHWKSAEELIRALLHCRRFGGNLLLNIGPRADGSVPEESVERLNVLGDYIARCPESIYSARRTAFSEAVHAAGVVTTGNGKVWLHALNPQSRQNPRLDGAAEIRPAGKDIFEVTLKPDARPAEMLGGRHDLEIKAGDAPVLGDNSAHYSPPEATLKIADELAKILVKPREISRPAGLYCPLYQAQALNITFPAGGVFDLEIGFVAAETLPAGTIAEFGSFAAVTYAPGFPETFRITGLESDGKTLTLTLPENFGIYAVRVQPQWHCLHPLTWDIAGFFASPYTKTNYTEDAEKTLAADIPGLAKTAAFVRVNEHNNLSDDAETRINAGYAAPLAGAGYCLAKRHIRIKEAQTVYACLGNDWWSRVWVNGQAIIPETPGYKCPPGHPTFVGHKPLPFTMALHAGDNEILVCNHGGHRANWFTFFTNLDLENC